MGSSWLAMSAEPKLNSGSSSTPREISNSCASIATRPRSSTASRPSARISLARRPAVNAACLGVPGPIIDGRAHATNVPWQLSTASLSRALNGVPVRLLNDLAAIAYGMVHLKPAEFAVLHRAEDPPEHGNIAVIAAGTGLGESSLVWEDNENKYYAVASEGGHSDFAPHGTEQIELLRFLTGEFGHVSYERVLSGPGLWNIYSFLRRESGVEEPSLAEGRNSSRRSVGRG